ncbi:MAG: hypothetical protein ABIH22_01385 [Candidatus Margulisiibacteriota bacterium]
MIEGVQGSQGYQEILNAQMFQRAAQATTSAERQKIKEEFLAIFYKELLKKAFKPPSFGLTENKNSLTGMFGADILADKLALELAQSKSFSIDKLFPTITERDIAAE